MLHHDFGDPRPVRRVVGPPRQRTAVLGEPAEQVFSEKRKALCIVHGKGGCMLNRESFFSGRHPHARFSGSPVKKYLAGRLFEGNPAGYVCFLPDGAV